MTYAMLITQPWQSERSNAKTKPAETTQQTKYIKQQRKMATYISALKKTQQLNKKAQTKSGNPRNYVITPKHKRNQTARPANTQ